MAATEIGVRLIPFHLPTPVMPVLAEKSVVNARNAASLVLRLSVAGIFGLLAVQKIPYHANARAIFEDVGGYPAALATAGLELVAAVLILIPRTVPVGALLSAAAMVGAIGTHLLLIGVAVHFPSAADASVTESDGGTLFAMAVGTLLASLTVLAMHRRDAIDLARSITRRAPRTATRDWE